VKYIIDTSSIITPHRNYYNVDIAPSFWDHLSNIINQPNGNVFIIDKVKEEILRGNDYLIEWINNIDKNKILITETDERVLQAYTEISLWVNDHDHYKERAKEQFLDAEKADAFLIAYAKAYNIEGEIIIVTEEMPSPDGALNRKKIKIPDVCRQLNIRYIHLFDFMREFNIRL